jgi:hypothetical protein
VKGHPQWKEEIAIFREVDPYQYILNSCFFDDMLDKFLKGPHDSEGASAEIRKIKADFVGFCI